MNNYLSGKHLTTFVLSNMGATYTRLTGLSNSDVLPFALCYKLEIQDKIAPFLFY